MPIIKPPFRQINWAHPLSRGLVFAVPFNEVGGSVNYDYGPGLASSWTQVATVDSNDAYGSAQLFDGATAYLWTPNNSRLPIYGGNACSIVGVFNFNTSSGTVKNICRQDSTTGSGLLVLQVSPAAEIVKAIFGAGGSTVASSGTTLLSPNTVYVGAAVYNGVDVRVYLNGHLDAAATALTGTIATPTQYAVIGAAANDLNATPSSLVQFFPGKISLVLVYARALTADEVAWISYDPFVIFRRPSKNVAFPGPPLTLMPQILT